MAKVNINLDGMKDLQRQIKKLEQSFPENATENISLRAAEVIAKDARGRVNVVTGRLRDSIKAKKWKKRKQVAEVLAAVDRSKSGAPHAGLVEFGTSRTTAKPYFAPAVLAKSAEARGILEDGLKKLVEEAVR